MTVLGNISTNLFLPKPAQAEKNECLTAGLVINNELYMTWKRPIGS